MKRRTYLLGSASACLLAACAAPPTPPKTPIENTVQGLWHGRMALQVLESAGQAAQSWSASFTLQGSPSAGQLDLFTPLGAQAAQLRWTPGQAELRQGQQVRSSDSLAALLELSLGTALPIDAFFAWLQGQAMDTAGWQADLSQHAQGRISARRLDPLPQAQLKIILQP